MPQRISHHVTQRLMPKGLRYINANEHNEDPFHETIRTQALEATRVFQHLYQYVHSLPSANSAWLHEPDLPTSREIGTLVNGRVKENKKGLQPNRALGAWDNKAFYLESQYQLFREDGISPLRDAVDEIRPQPRLMEKDSKEHARIYEGAFIIGVNLGRRGLTVKVEFSTKRAEKRIRWAQSKRLKSGTIVALSPATDSFQSVCKVAVVAARPLLGLEVDFPMKPSVHLEFSDPEEIDIDPQVEWIMLEASGGYWEAYRHTLRALQKLHGETFPLARHVVNVEADVSYPAYRKGSPEMDLSSVCTDSYPNLKSVNVLSDWPDLTAPGRTKIPMSELDESQLIALRRILTRNLAIVQGPPGTGKTHVSVQALRVMLANMSAEDPPIIVSAHTNHALDQLLRHIARFEPGFARLGGQTTDKEVIIPRTMQKIRESAGANSTSTSRQARTLEKQLAGQLQELLNPLLSDTPLSTTTLFNHGVISKKQLESLENLNKNWVGENFHDLDDPICMFCEDQIKPFRKANETALLEEYEECDERLKSEEEDVEIEFNDDRFELLHGHYFPFCVGFISEPSSESSDSMAQKMLDRHQDMSKIPLLHRGAVYDYLQKTVKAEILKQVRLIAVKAKAMSKNFQIGRWEQDHLLLKNIRVIGMTTTGLSKYRALVTSLEPKIVLIEEAAETLEAYTTAAFLPSLEHLILVGDHQQLRGHCNVKEFESAPWNLDVSMFERFVRNKVEFTQLKMQRRMRPEIREIINPIYKELTDHPSVRNRKDIPGMGGLNTCFLTHRFPESNDDALSKQNIHEARLIVSFYYYLYLNGTDTKKITVLTFYNGQRKMISKCISQHKVLSNLCCNVATVDSYQGEENDIVLLSMVRNNDKGQIGFLNVDNRVCVALSRARCGFYLFGEAIAVYNFSDLWRSVLNIMGELQVRIREFLPVVCKNHGTTTLVNDAGHLEDLDGGCRKSCNEQRPCGHTCKLQCHPHAHEDIVCEQRCTERLDCGHICSNQCWYQQHECATCDPKPEIPLLEETSRTPSPQKNMKVSGRGRPGASSPPKQTSGGLPHTQHGKAYRDFAAGGVLQQDARMRNEIQQKYDETIEKSALDSIARVETRYNEGDVLIDLDRIDQPNLLATDFPALPSRAKPSTRTQGESNPNTQGPRKVWNHIWKPPAVEKKVKELGKKKQAPISLLD